MISLLIAIIYLAFISLGLPDSLLGSVWPIIYQEFGVPISYSGIIFIIISLGTVVSSLMSDRLTKKLGAGKVTAISVAMTALALLGFSISGSFILLCIFAVPYGLGAGSVDAALNNYVALHFKAKHMSWLHCMWGIGATVGPYIMSAAVAHTGLWNTGYRITGIIQVIIAAVIFISLPLWKKNVQSDEGISCDAGKTESIKKTEDKTVWQDNGSVSGKALSLKDIVKIKGAKEIMITFFCYCALEQTVGLWASSYLVVGRGVEETTAAAFASLFFVGITVGRAVNGFLAMKFSDRQLIITGQGITALGILLIFIPSVHFTALAGFVVVGLGCAPIYPCIIHSTPYTFGKDRSQAMIGVQMASAYIGNTVMAPLFGLIAKHVSISLLPAYLLIILIIMFFMYMRVQKQRRSENHA